MIWHIISCFWIPLAGSAEVLDIVRPWHFFLVDSIISKPLGFHSLSSSIAVCHQPKIGAWTVAAGVPPPRPLLPALLRFQDLALEPTPRSGHVWIFISSQNPARLVTSSYKFRTASFRWESLAGSSPTHPCATCGAACKCKSVYLRQNGTKCLRNSIQVYRKILQMWAPEARNCMQNWWRAWHLKGYNAFDRFWNPSSFKSLASGSTDCIFNGRSMEGQKLGGAGSIAAPVGGMDVKSNRIIPNNMLIKTDFKKVNITIEFQGFPWYTHWPEYLCCILVYWCGFVSRQLYTVMASWWKVKFGSSMLVP